MAETGRNWTRRSIEELVEDYLKKHGGSGGDLIGSIPAGYPWNPNNDPNTLYDSALPMIYYKGLEYTGDRGGSNAGWTFKFCPYLIYAPQEPWQYQVSTQRWYDKAANRNRGIDGPNFMSDQRFIPLFLGHHAVGLDYLYQSLSIAYNGYGSSGLYPNQIILDKDEFTGGNDEFGEPGVYVCLRDSSNPSVSPTNINFYWCKFANAFVAANLFNNTQTCNFTNTTGQSLDANMCAKLNSMLEGVVTRNFPSFHTQSSYHWGAVWLFILPHGNVNPGLELFKYDYIDLGLAYNLPSRYVYGTHGHQVVS